MKKARFSWIPVIICLGCIYLFSSQSGERSNELSVQAAEVLSAGYHRLGLDAVADVPMDKAEFHLWLRKAAHFLEYFVCGMLVFQAFRRSGKTKISLVLLSFLFCLVFVAGDELYQYFVPGRTNRLSDMVIDGAGVLSAMMVSLAGCMLAKWRRKDGNRKNIEKKCLQS